MILVTVGTIHYEFKRMADVAAHITNNFPKQRVVVQSGHTQAFDKLKNLAEVRAFIPQNELWNLMKKADVVLMHGGEGSLLDAIEWGTYVPIVFPRNPKYGEHVDGYQLEIAREACRRGICRAVFSESQATASVQECLSVKKRSKNIFRLRVQNNALIDFLDNWSQGR